MPRLAGFSLITDHLIRVFPPGRRRSRGASRQPPPLLAGVQVDEEEDGLETGQSDAAAAAVRQAESEGLTLQPSDNSATGYLNVYKGSCHDLAKPFHAQVWLAAASR